MTGIGPAAAAIVNLAAPDWRVDGFHGLSGSKWIGDWPPQLAERRVSGLLPACLSILLFSSSSSVSLLQRDDTSRCSDQGHALPVAATKITGNGVADMTEPLERILIGLGIRGSGSNAAAKENYRIARKGSWTKQSILCPHRPLGAHEGAGTAKVTSLLLGASWKK